MLLNHNALFRAFDYSYKDKCMLDYKLLALTREDVNEAILGVPVAR